MTDDRKIVTTGKRSLTIQHGTGAANVIDQVLSDALALARSSEVSKEAFTEINGIMFDQLSVQQLEIWAKTILFDQDEDSTTSAEITLSELVELMNLTFFGDTYNCRSSQIEHWVCDGKIVAACFPGETYWRKGELDLSQLTALILIGADSNQLTQLDVSNNPELTKLWVSDNQLTELDVSNNPELTELWVSDNQLTELDVSNNPELTLLGVMDNQLTELDVSNNPELTKLRVSDNQLTALRFSNEMDLENLPDIEIPTDLKFDKVKGCYTNE